MGILGGLLLFFFSSGMFSLPHLLRGRGLGSTIIPGKGVFLSYEVILPHCENHLDLSEVGLDAGHLPGPWSPLSYDAGPTRCGGGGCLLHVSFYLRSDF